MDGKQHSFVRMFVRIGALKRFHFLKKKTAELPVSVEWDRRRGRPASGRRRRRTSAQGRAPRRPALYLGDGRLRRRRRACRSRRRRQTDLRLTRPRRRQPEVDSLHHDVDGHVCRDARLVHQPRRAAGPRHRRPSACRHDLQLHRCQRHLRVAGDGRRAAWPGRPACLSGLHRHHAARRRVVRGGGQPCLVVGWTVCLHRGGVWSVRRAALRRPARSVGPVRRCGGHDIVRGLGAGACQRALHADRPGRDCDRGVDDGRYLQRARRAVGRARGGADDRRQARPVDRLCCDRRGVHRPWQPGVDRTCRQASSLAGHLRHRDLRLHGDRERPRPERRSARSVANGAARRVSRADRRLPPVSGRAGGRAGHPGAGAGKHADHAAGRGRRRRRRRARPQRHADRRRGLDAGAAVRCGSRQPAHRLCAGARRIPAALHRTCASDASHPAPGHRRLCARGRRRWR